MHAREEAREEARAGSVKLSVRHRQRIAAVPFPQFALIRVDAGTKRIGAGDAAADIEAGPGSLIAVAGGSVLTIENVPPAHGRYAAVCIEIDTGAVRRAARQIGDVPPRTAALHLAAMPEYLSEAIARLAQGLERAELPAAVLAARVAEVTAALETCAVPVWAMCRPSFAERVRRHLATNLAAPPAPAAVAAALHMSPATLRRRLADERTSYRALLDDLRLSAGLAWVQGSDMSIARIADRCGYGSASRFTQRFRARFGTTPSALRG